MTKYKGPLGFDRLTGIGPLVDSSVTDIPPPSFKTKTFKWDKVDFRFESSGGGMITRDTIENPGGRGVERGSSFSLDGAYNDYRGYMKEGYSDYITFLYPLNEERDVPFFYINPKGSKEPTIINGRQTVIESPTFIGEAEVAVREPIDPSDAIGVVITIDEDDIRKLKEEKKEELRNNEDAEKYGWKDRALKRVDRESEWAIETINNIKENFNILEEVPRTEFRDKVQQVTNDIDGYSWKDDWAKVEEITRPVHTTIADTYGIDYSAVKREAESKLQ